MSGNIDAVARRQASKVSQRVRALENRITALETAIQRLYAVVPPPAPTGPTGSDHQ